MNLLGQLSEHHSNKQDKQTSSNMMPASNNTIHHPSVAQALWLKYSTDRLWAPAFHSVTSSRSHGRGNCSVGPLGRRLTGRAGAHPLPGEQAREGAAGCRRAVPPAFLGCFTQRSSGWFRMWFGTVEGVFVVFLRVGVTGHHPKHRPKHPETI